MTDTKNSNPAGAQDLNEKVKATAASATDEAKARAKDVADTVASDAARYADEAKGAAASEVRGVASALRTPPTNCAAGRHKNAPLASLQTGLRMLLTPCATRIWARWSARYLTLPNATPSSFWAVLPWSALPRHGLPKRRTLAHAANATPTRGARWNAPYRQSARITLIQVMSPAPP